VRAKAIEAVCLVSLLGRAPHTHAHNFSYPFVKGKSNKKSPNEQINKKTQRKKNPRFQRTNMLVLKEMPKSLLHPFILL